jgi:molybdopterin synthase catalytic subunit
MIAVNQEIAQDETLVSDGDEVAFLPPFAGGSH